MKMEDIRNQKERAKAAEVLKRSRIGEVLKRKGLRFLLFFLEHQYAAFFSSLSFCR